MAISLIEVFSSGLSYRFWQRLEDQGQNRTVQARRRLGVWCRGVEKYRNYCTGPKQYNTYTENFVKANETLRELYWEALRAPTTNALFQRNPYRREKLIKHHLGRTKAERVANAKKISADFDAHISNVDKIAVEEANKKTETSASDRKKRLDYARQRSKLGFKDKTKDIETNGVEDEIFDKLAIDDRKYQKMLAESRERKPVKMPTDVEGISKSEISKKVLEIPGAIFKP